MDPPPPYSATLNDEVVRLRMDRESVNTGEIHACCLWNDIADLDLHVVAPSGEHLYFGHKESECGGWLDVDMNAGMVSLEPIENIFWASAPSGKYHIYVHNFNNRTDERTVFTDRNRKVPFRVRLTRGSAEPVWFSGAVGPFEKLTCFEFHHEGRGAVGSFVVLPPRPEKLTFADHCRLSSVTYSPGHGFYALLKKEKVSKGKSVLLHDTVADVFTIGRAEVFQCLGLPETQDNMISPSTVPAGHTLFVQSTSHNRLLPAETSVLMKVPMREALQIRRQGTFRLRPIEP
jgi:uncharacterized protein DUF2135